MAAARASVVRSVVGPSPRSWSVRRSIAGVIDIDIDIQISISITTSIDIDDDVVDMHGWGVTDPRRVFGHVAP